MTSTKQAVWAYHARGFQVSNIRRQEFRVHKIWPGWYGHYTECQKRTCSPKSKCT